MVEQQLRESTKYAFLLPDNQGGGGGGGGGGGLANGDALTVVDAKLKVGLLMVIVVWMLGWMVMQLRCNCREHQHLQCGSETWFLKSACLPPTGRLPLPAFGCCPCRCCL